MTKQELLKVPKTLAATCPLGMSPQNLIDGDKTLLIQDQLLFSASS